MMLRHQPTKQTPIVLASIAVFVIFAMVYCGLEIMYIITRGGA